MVTLKRPRVLALVLAGLGLLWVLWLQVGKPVALLTVESDTGTEAKESPLPRIALDRLDRPPAEPETGSTRDIFGYGAPKATEQPATPPPVAVHTPPPVDIVHTPPPTTLAPFNVKFVGTMESQGVKVAVLMTADKNEVLIGREGETVANRLKIVRIGFESVDVQDVGSAAPRRIPLRAN
jgi:hypothetical protein